MRQKIDRFTRRLSTQEFVLGCVILLPLFFYSNSYIVSALIKWFILTFKVSAYSTTATVWLNFMVDLINALAGLLILRQFISRQWKDFMKNKSTILIAGCIVGVFLNYIANGVGNGIISLFVRRTTSINQQQVEALTKNLPILMLITTGLLAPIGEELIFRGVIFTGIRKYNKILAYLVSAFLFGFIHVMSSVFAGNISEMIQMIPYMGSGLVFAYIYESQDNIFASILTHMTNNLIAILILIL